MKKTKVQVPVKRRVEYEFFQIRGVRKDHVKFVKEQAYALGYSSYGEYMNALLDEVRGLEAGDKVCNKGRQRS